MLPGGVRAARRWSSAWPPRSCRPDTCLGRHGARGAARGRPDGGVRGDPAGPGVFRHGTTCPRRWHSRTTGSAKQDQRGPSGGRCVIPGQGNARLQRALTGLSRSFFRSVRTKQPARWSLTMPQACMSGVRRGGADEAEAPVPKVLGQGGRLRRRWPGRRRSDCGPGWPSGGAKDHSSASRPPSSASDRPGVGDRCCDLRAVADDARVGEQPRTSSSSSNAATRTGREVGEGPAESLPLAQDREPGQPGLERLEDDPLEQSRVTVHRSAPLLVVVGRCSQRRGPGHPHGQRARPSGPGDRPLTTAHAAALDSTVPRPAAAATRDPDADDRSADDRASRAGRAGRAEGRPIPTKHPGAAVGAAAAPRRRRSRGRPRPRAARRTPRRLPLSDGHGVEEPERAQPGERLEPAVHTDATLSGGSHPRSERPFALAVPVDDVLPGLLGWSVDLLSHHELSHDRARPDVSGPVRTARRSVNVAMSASRCESSSATRSRTASTSSMR